MNGRKEGDEWYCGWLDVPHILQNTITGAIGSQFQWFAFMGVGRYLEDYLTRILLRQGMYIGVSLPVGTLREKIPAFAGKSLPDRYDPRLSNISWGCLGMAATSAMTQRRMRVQYTVTHAARFNQINWYCNEAEELCSTWLGPCGLQWVGGWGEVVVACRI